MAARLWPRAWEIFLLGVLVGFALLEEMGFTGKRPLHRTLSRWTARFPHAVPAIAAAGPALSWAYAWHIRNIQQEDPS